MKSEPTKFKRITGHLVRKLCTVPRCCAKVRFGIGVPPKIGATVTRPLNKDSGFFYVPCCAGNMAPFMAGRVGASKDAPVPISGTPTLHGLSPSIGVGGDRFTTCQIGANMATTLTLGGSAHVTTGHTPATTSNSKLGRLMHTRIIQRRYPALTAPQAAPSISRQQAIENALCMALHYIRTTDTQQGIQAATAKAIRAASLLKQASTESTFSGRA